MIKSVKLLVIVGVLTLSAPKASAQFGRGIPQSPSEINNQQAMESLEEMCTETNDRMQVTKDGYAMYEEVSNTFSVCFYMSKTIGRYGVVSSGYSFQLPPYLTPSGCVAQMRATGQQYCQ